jgi:hypothetical protein
VGGVWTGLAAVLGLGYLVTQGSALASGAWALPQRQAAARLVPTLVWVQEHTRPGDTIATGLDPAVYLYTGRQAIPPSSWASSDYVLPLDAPIFAERIGIMVTTFQPDYLIIQHRLNQLQAGLDHLSAMYPGRLIPVAELEDGTRIFTLNFEQVPP